MSRVQLALNVDNLDESISFYSRLFNTQPAKVRPGYANFAVAEPPLKLILMENPGQGGSINHLGVEVETVDEVDSEQRMVVLPASTVDPSRSMTGTVNVGEQFGRSVEYPLETVVTPFTS